MSNEDPDLAERVRIAVEMDITAASKLMGCADPEVVEMALHKARIEMTKVPMPLREESLAWLRERGLTRRGGFPLPEHPEG